MLTAPVLDLFQEISVKQLRQSWGTPVVRSRHSTEETFALLEPRQTIGQLDPSLPLLLVYSRRDPIAPAAFGHELKAAAPQATLIEDRRASHVTMTLMPGINRQVARWLRQALLPEAGSEPR
jgi:pimeloyl-ACP methyl ester carboxylesterase